MLLNIPQLNLVDSLVVGEDTAVVDIARRLRSAGRGVAVLLLGTAQEARFSAAAMKQLLGLGVELLLETTPVTPLLVAGDRVGGWVVLGRGGYLALPARMVVDATATRTLCRQLPPSAVKGCEKTLDVDSQLIAPEEFMSLHAWPVENCAPDTKWSVDTTLLWHYESPRYAECQRRIAVKLSGGAVECSTQVLVVGGGHGGRAAAQAAQASGAQVACMDAAQVDFPKGVVGYSGLRLGGVMVRHRRIVGVLAWERSGLARVIHAEVVIDATGEALVAHAAGAPVSPLIPEAMPSYGGWGASLGGIHLDAISHGVPFCSGDAVDSTRAQVFELLRGAGKNMHPGERQRIVGELVLQPQDVILQRHYLDTVAIAQGELGDSGSGSLALLLRLVPQMTRWCAWLPLRALLPLKLDGLLVIGRGVSLHWELLPLIEDPAVRVQLGAAVGLVAAAAACGQCGLREVALRPIQEQLVAAAQLPPEILGIQEDENGAVLTRERLTLYQVAVILQRPDRARRQLQAAFDQQPTVLMAELLAFLGDSTGRDCLKQCLDEASWDICRDAGQNLECVILALRDIGGGAMVLLRKLGELTSTSEFRLLRAVCLYLQRWPLPEAAEQLERILTTPGFAGHAKNWAEDSPEEYAAQVREIYVAGALHACAPDSAVALRSLQAYRASPRLLQAVFARALME